MRTTTFRKLVTGAVAATILTGATAGIALAHDRGDERHERMARVLELSDEQQAQLQQLWSERREAMLERRDERGGKGMALGALDPTADNFDAEVEKLIADAQARVAERIQAQAEMKRKMSEILTPEQREKWQAMMAERGERGEHGFGKHHGKKDRDCH